MNTSVQPSAEPELEVVLNNINVELTEARKTAEVLYNTVSRISGFNLKCDDALKSEEAPSSVTFLNKLRDVSSSLGYINAKNNEILSQLNTLI